MSTNYSNNRERVIALINSGSATRASICEAIGFKNTSLASIFSQLRLMGQYPIEDDNKILSLVDKATYEGRVTQTPAKAAVSPEERALRLTQAYLKAEARVNKTKITKSDSEEAGLLYKVASADFNLAKFRAANNELAMSLIEKHVADQAAVEAATAAATQTN